MADLAPDRIDMQPPDKEKPAAGGAAGSPQTSSGQKTFNENEGNADDCQEKQRQSALSNSLADLAERVRAAATEMRAAERTSIDRALHAGALLIDAKAACPHGSWLPFLERAGVADRTARNFMTLAASGLESATVADLGGVRAALAFLSRWRLPTFDETMVIRDPERPAGESPVGRGAAFVWESEHHRGLHEIGIITEKEELVHTRRPMRPMIACQGDRPVNAIIHFLTLHLTLPIDAWEIGYMPREPRMTLVLAPFWADDTLRGLEVSP